MISLCGVVFAEECHLAYNLSLLLLKLRLGILCKSLVSRFTWTEPAYFWALILFGSKRLSDIENLSQCLDGGKLLGRGRAWKCLAILVLSNNYLWMRWCLNHMKFWWPKHGLSFLPLLLYTLGFRQNLLSNQIQHLSRPWGPGTWLTRTRSIRHRSMQMKAELAH